ncbi:MAG: FecR family protein, partial [Verrucomicrobiota bacterium]
MNRRNVESQLQGLIDGTLEAAERADLLSRIKSDPLLLETYCEYAQIESALRRIAASEGAMWADQMGSISGNQGRSKRWIVKVSALSAAAALILLAAAHHFIVFARPESVRYRLTPGSVCEVSHAVAGKGEPPMPGTLGIGSRAVLTQGTAELCFACGIRAVVRAPADLTLHAKQQLDLDRGVAWFHVPPSAADFRVQTPEMVICDLGTEFGIRAQPNQADEIHVMKGNVEVHTRRESSTVETLRQGEARAVGSTGRMQMIGVEPDHFLTRLASTIPYLHWSFNGDPSACIAADGSHPAAACAMSELIGQGDPAAFASTPGRFGVALHATGIFADAKTAWTGISGKAPRTIAHWLKLPHNQVGAQA